jgi:hypothetical protein
MVTFLIFMALVVGFAVLVAKGCGHAGSSNIIDRDIQRLHGELNAMLSHSHHR